MVKRNAENWKNPMIHLSSRVAHSICTKAKWARSPTVRGFPSFESHHHPQPLPNATNAGTAGKGVTCEQIIVGR